MDLALVVLELLGFFLGWLAVLGLLFAVLLYGGAHNPPWVVAFLHHLVQWARLRGAAESDSSRKRVPSQPAGTRSAEAP